jgi:hypothetical protein
VIRFLTLFVGLVVGHQNVELAVSGPADRVELRVNGSLVGAKNGEPWVVRCDFGREPHPGRLEALALDGRGRVIGTDLQWINLPAARAEASIVPKVDQREGRVVSARLTWTSPEFENPRSLRVTLNGRELTVTAPYVIDLRSAGPDQVQVLTAEFVFSSEVQLRRELVFGKGFAGNYTSGLTALPVSLDDIDVLPPAAEMEGWFLGSGEPLRVAGVERERSQLVVVSDPTTQSLLEDLYRERKREGKRGRRRGGGPRLLDELDEDVEIWVLIPEPFLPDDRLQATLLFPIGKKPVPGPEGLLKAVLASRQDRVIGAGLMLGDGVAMAAIRAAGGNQRRMVLLLLGPEREDISRVRPTAARRFLHDLHVPLVVWDLTGERSSPPAGWQPDREIRGLEDLRRATRRLRYALDQQRIVWVGGRHLPQRLELGPGAEGITLLE